MKAITKIIVWALLFLSLPQLTHAQIPQFTLGKDTTLCEGDLLLINLIDLNANVYTWQDGSTNAFYVIQKPGKYSVTVGKNNETITKSINVKYAKYPTLNLGNDTTTCQLLPITINLNNPNSTFLWSDGNRNQYRTITKEGTYSVKVSNGKCATSDTINITEIECKDFQFYAPNAFSPNGDDNNDTWEISFIHDFTIKSYLLQVFDKWGNQIFNTSDVKQQWDGLYKSEPVQQDNYVYRLSLTYLNPYTKKEKSLNTNGNILLIK